MTYQFYPKRINTYYMMQRQGLSQIVYIPKNKMDELYPDGCYEVIGEIGNFAIKYASQDVIVTSMESINIFPRGSLKKPFEWIVGYAAVKEDTYVAVVKRVIPRMTAIIRFFKVRDIK